jgi:two-component system chemotaxis response regulator CheV
MEQMDAESYLKTGSNELRILEYQIAGQSFGINILKVSKIVNDLADFTKVPESHPAVPGMFRDQGRIIPLIDLAMFLGTDAIDVRREKVVVTEFFGMLTGFRVERVDWIHHFKWEDVIDSQTVFSGIDQKYVIGIVRPTEERMILLLDYETILLDLSPHLRDMDVASYKGNSEFTGKRVLIAEDSPAVRSMLVNEMSELGFEVNDFSDGEQAWRAFQEQSYDLVISDVEMPQMDGLALTMRIRQSENPETPVIVYSSIGDLGMKARASFLKADAHVTKLNLDLLIETADKLIRGEKVNPDEMIDSVPEPEITEMVSIE